MGNEQHKPLPRFKSALNIKCLTCPQIVKSDGVTVCEHTVLEHKYSKGEKACVCRRCAYDRAKSDRLTGPVGNWKPVSIEKP